MNKSRTTDNETALSAEGLALFNKKLLDELAETILTRRLQARFDPALKFLELVQKHGPKDRMFRQFVEKSTAGREKDLFPRSETEHAVEKELLAECRAEAEKRIYSRINLKRPPADTCVLCGKSLQDIGGYRIVTQKLRGIGLSETRQGGGNKDFPKQSFKLYDDRDVYVVVWGEPAKWTEAAKKRTRDQYRAGYRPWMCSVCAERKCRNCGAPINYPMGSDVLYDNGCSSHVPIFPFDPGCTNPACSRYKEWEKIMPYPNT